LRIAGVSTRVWAYFLRRYEGGHIGQGGRNRRPRLRPFELLLARENHKQAHSLHQPILDISDLVRRWSVSAMRGVADGRHSLAKDMGACALAAADCAIIAPRVL